MYDIYVAQRNTYNVCKDFSETVKAYKGGEFCRKDRVPEDKAIWLMTAVRGMGFQAHSKIKTSFKDYVKLLSREELLQHQEEEMLPMELQEMYEGDQL